MPDFPSAITVSILILALVFAILIARKLTAFVPPPVKGPKSDAGELAAQVDAEHIAAIHAVLTHHFGATPESLRVTRIKPL